MGPESKVHEVPKAAVGNVGLFFIQNLHRIESEAVSISGVQMRQWLLTFLRRRYLIRCSPHKIYTRLYVPYESPDHWQDHEWNCHIHIERRPTIMTIFLAIPFWRTAVLHYSSKQQSLSTSTLHFLRVEDHYLYELYHLLIIYKVLGGREH